MKRNLVRGTLIVCLLIVGMAHAAGPNLLSYQGQVLTSGGAPIPNGTYPVIFALFPVSSGGAPLWSENVLMPVTSGLLTYTLGSGNNIPANLFASNSSVWLEISVNGQIQTPRTQITSVGNALSVSTVDGATGGTISGNTSFQNDLTVTGNVGIGTASPSSKLEVVGDLKVSGNIIGSTPWTPINFYGVADNYVDVHGGGFQTCQFRKIGDIVYLRGLMHRSNHTTFTGVVTGYLGPGFTPSATLRFATHPDSSFIDITFDPFMTIYAHSYNRDYISLDGISFSTTP